MSLRILFFGLVYCISFSSIVKADQRDPRLQNLFDNLQNTQSSFVSNIIEQKIWTIWLESSDHKITKLMNQGSSATQSGNFPKALKVYTDVIRHNPNYAEGWNKRALTYYLLKDYEQSLSDIRKTLTLEPRHFGAKSGQGLIYSAQQKWSLAKKAFLEALTIHPHMRGPQINLEAIRKHGLEEEI